ncbi:hypothetical protein Nepgr_026882 [Nepenthes gracilis]|uniref:DUF4408 domain-containing protein n=1 Tax=Nepenthes gracilis TaxID=150966 RepID=A0AAD3T9T8_NEPGR|nr:hypothetical protein Nepgr_026882 [Nepenthes gracilis]
MIYHILSSLINPTYVKREKKRWKMDQNQQIKNNKVGKFYYQFMKKVIKFIVSFSVFSFFFSNPSWLGFFLRSFISHLSNFPSQLLSHVHDKIYVFLLCNGIVVFLAKYSGKMISSSPPQVNLEDEFFGDDGSLSPWDTVPPSTSSTSPESFEEVERGAGEEEREREREREEEGNGEENKGLNEELMEKEDSGNGYSTEEEEEEEEGGGWVGDGGEIARMSTEDLNRKFEDFIRKMKEEIRIEAQRQLVMV